MMLNYQNMILSKEGYSQMTDLPKFKYSLNIYAKELKL